MRLSNFIRRNVEQISMEWELFAASCSPAADTMSGLALGVKNTPILFWIPTHLETLQTKQQQNTK
jgi:hypothetical protein